MAELRWVLFDLNGTLLDPRTMAAALGAEPGDGQLVLAVLDDAVAEAMADTLCAYRPLRDYLRAALERRLRLEGRSTEPVGAALKLAARMDSFPDSRRARASAGRGLEVGVVTNSATASAEEALQAAGSARAALAGRRHRPGSGLQA